MELVYSQGEITTRDKTFNILGPAVLPKFTTQLLSKAFRRCVCVFFFKPDVDFSISNDSLRLKEKVEIFPVDISETMYGILFTFMLY